MFTNLIKKEKIRNQQTKKRRRNLVDTASFSNIYVILFKIFFCQIFQQFTIHHSGTTQYHGHINNHQTKCNNNPDKRNPSQ